MTAQVISMQSVSRTDLDRVLAEMNIDSFRKALAVVKRLTGCTANERINSLQNWLIAGLISAAEYDSVLEFYEYRRAK